MLLQGFGGYTRGCASAPLQNSTTIRRGERPIRKRQPLQVPDEYHRRGSGATVGDNHKGTLITGGNPFSFANNKNTNELTNYKLHPKTITARQQEPTAQATSAARQTINPSTPRAKLCFARRAQHRTAGTPPRSRAGRPLGRDSASLEGWTPPRARLRLARGLDAPSGGSPPRLRLSRVDRSRTHSPDRSINHSDTMRAPGSKANPRHASPLTPLGNHIPALFRQPLW
jgi:hypothetical protein